MNQNEIDHLVAEWEHGAMNRREFFERAVLVMGSLGAAEGLLAACSPAVAPTALGTPGPQASTTLAATAAPATYSAVSTASSASAASPAPTTVPASAIPGYVDPSAINASQVTYPSGSVTMSALLARPKTGNGPWPGVIVIHENRGLTDHIQDVARRIANLGYVALGVDLLSRLGGTQKFSPPADPTQAINSLKQEDVDADLLASVAYLKSQSFVKNKIGVVGFCWGGANSLLTAINSKDIAACIVFYGRNPANIDDVQKLVAPVQGNYGELDQFVTPGVPALEAAMKKYGKSFDPKIFPGANHAFFNNTGPRYNEAAAKQAWARLVDFYKQNLQS